MGLMPFACTSSLPPWSALSPCDSRSVLLPPTHPPTYVSQHNSSLIQLTYPPTHPPTHPNKQEEDVLGMIKRVFLPWINAFRFFQQGIARLGMEKGVRPTHPPTHPPTIVP